MSANQSRDLAWVYPVHDQGRQPHESGIEDVEVPLGRQNLAFPALGILRETYDGSDEDEDADGVKAEHVLLPWVFLALLGWALAETEVEENADDDE